MELFKSGRKGQPLGRCATCLQPLDRAEALEAPDNPKILFCCEEHRARYLLIEAERKARPRVRRTRGSCLGTVVGATILGGLGYMALLWADAALGLGLGIPNFLPFRWP